MALVQLVISCLLTPGLVACDGSGGTTRERAIVVGTTDRFAASKEAPAPLDPAYAYDIGTWNVLRQTVQTLMIMPKGDGNPVPEAAEKCGFT
ncbi:peptide-binding protein, partial [Streptomyces spiralis]